jgi:hypothetical protein
MWHRCEQCGLRCAMCESHEYTREGPVRHYLHWACSCGAGNRREVITIDVDLSIFTDP